MSNAELKEQGNELVKQGKFQDAVVVYSDALRQLDKKKNADGGGGAGQEAAEDALLRRTLHSNRAQCRLKLQQWRECVSDCDAALDGDRGNVKVLYRRAQAHLGLKQVDGAFKDLKLLLEQDKDNKAALALMQKLRALAAEMGSTTAQTLEYIDAAAAEGVSEQVRASKLRAVLGSVMEDQHLARSICDKGACDKLWSMRELPPHGLALKLVSKLSEFDGCFEAVLKSVSGEQLIEVVSAAEAADAAAAGQGEEGEGGAAEGQSAAASGDGPAAALNALWRLCIHEDELRGKDEAYSAKVDSLAVIKALTGALRSDRESLRRVAVEGVVRLASDKKLQTERARAFVGAGGMGAVMSVIARDLDNNAPVQQASVVLGQILPSLKSDDDIKRQALELCQPGLKSGEPAEQTQGVAALDAIYYANKELGEALVTEEGLLDLVHKIAHYGTARAQALACEVFSHLSNSEKGRGLLAGDVTELLKKLAVHSAAQVRSAAAVTLAKLNALDFNAQSEDGVLVLSSVAALLKPSASKEEHAKGVEAVAFVVNDAQVKMLFIKGDGLDVLKEMIKLASENAKDAYAYGLSFCFESLVSSEDDKRREKLREMEVTEEQWEQFETLTKSSTRKPGQDDPRAHVEMRIKVFVEVGGIAALRALVLESTSERVWEAVSRSLCNIATVQDARRQMIAQGALRALFKLTHEGTEKCKKFAAHALGKIFVTTNPNLVKDEQLMDAIGPMVRQVRHSDEDLVIFECCMALTNIATVSLEAKQKMANVKAVQAFEYATYSDNLQVRRAACEAISNMVPTEEVLTWLGTPEKMRLWLLFCQSGDEDPPTASACVGALANAAADERVALALKQQEPAGSAIKTIVDLVKDDDINLAHRAVVCTLMLADSWPDNAGPQALRDAGAKDACQLLLRKFPDSAAAPAATDLLALLA